MSKKVLVTGAAGFIGSHVAEHCLAQGMQVVATDNLSGGRRENVPKKAQWVQGDLRDAHFVKSLWNYGPYEYVYHLAAYAAEGLSHFIRKFNYETNVMASVHLINESIKHDVKCFVFTSSIAVYGQNQLPMTEDLVPQPEDPYGISKLTVEMDLKSAHRLFGMKWIIFRPHNVYGERQNVADKYRNVTNIFMSQLLRGEPMTIFGDGMQTRAFSYIDDVAPIIAKSPTVVTAHNQIFNIGADTPVSILDLSKLVAKSLKLPHRVIHFPARPEVVHAFSDHSKVRKVFNPPTPLKLEEGVVRVARWVKSIGPVEPTPLETIEIQKNLPSAWSNASSLKKKAA